jgi:hypothetical protein
MGVSPLGYKRRMSCIAENPESTFNDVVSASGERRLFESGPQPSDWNRLADPGDRRDQNAPDWVMAGDEEHEDRGIRLVAAQSAAQN